MLGNRAALAAAVIFALAGAQGSGSEAATLSIDEFMTGQYAAIGTGLPSFLDSSQVDDLLSLGGQRDMYVEGAGAVQPGSGLFYQTYITSDSGFLTMSVGTGRYGQGYVMWDGVDGSASPQLASSSGPLTGVNYQNTVGGIVGLNGGSVSDVTATSGFMVDGLVENGVGRDFSLSGQLSNIAIQVMESDNPATVLMEVWSDGGREYGYLDVEMPTNVGPDPIRNQDPQMVFFNYANFNGTVDFSNVSAMSLTILSDDTGLDTKIDFVGATSLEQPFEDSNEVPEPGAVGLLGFGVLGAAFIIRRHQRSKRPQDIDMVHRA